MMYPRRTHDEQPNYPWSTHNLTFLHVTFVTKNYKQNKDHPCFDFDRGYSCVFGVGRGYSCVCAVCNVSSVFRNVFVTCRR